jgi:hypothetical protein
MKETLLHGVKRRVNSACSNGSIALVFIIALNDRIIRSRDSSVDISTRLRTGRPRNRGFIPARGKKLSPQRPDRTWGPHLLICTGYRGLFPWGLSGWGVKLTTHLHLVPRLRMVSTFFHSLIRLYGVMLN